VTSLALATDEPATWPGGPRLQAAVSSLRRDFPPWRFWLSDERRVHAQRRNRDVPYGRYEAYSYADADNPREMREQLARRR